MSTRSTGGVGGGGSTPAAHQPPTPFTYFKTRFCVREKGAREGAGKRAQPDTTPTQHRRRAGRGFTRQEESIPPEPKSNFPAQAFDVGQTGTLFFQRTVRCRPASTVQLSARLELYSFEYSSLSASQYCHALLLRTTGLPINKYHK